MTTSGSSNFTQSRNEIVKDALILIKVLKADEDPTPKDLTFGSNILNKLIKDWQGQEVFLWKEVEGTLFLREGVSTYTLASTNGDKAGDNVVETTISADEAAAQTVLSITDTTGMTIGDQVGIELDDGTRQWTTITNVTSTTITVNNALTGAAAANNTVFSYTTSFVKPLKITSVRFRNASGIDTPVYIYGRTEFMNITDKTVTTAQPNCIYYSEQLNSGLVYVWGVPDSVSGRLKISYLKDIEDFDASADNADFPAKWLKTITYCLAADLAPAYEVDQDTFAKVKMIADEAFTRMASFNTEESSVRIIPNLRDYE